MTGKNILFNDGWQFCLTENFAVKELSDLERQHWYNVELPHDWLVGDTANLYKSGDGWYRKIFTVEKEQLAGKVLLNFDGVYHDSTIFVNGKEAFSWTYGYSAFEADITPYLFDGKNEVLVRVRHRAPNTRWYSGAGIFRDVTLKILPDCYIRTNGVYIHSDRQPDGSYVTEVDTDVCGSARKIKVFLCVYDPTGAHAASFAQDVQFGGGAECFTNTFTTRDPLLWDVDSPACYTLVVSLYAENGELLHEVSSSFGYKDAQFLPDKGLVLNGRQIKLHGVCMHHDLGALGAAYNEDALYRQLTIMKQMGVNAIRTSHNPPARQLMDMCDALGLLVDDECFDMWENPKTEFDNARFFKEYAERDVKSWVERDRNHPSLLMWSIGNEIADTNDPHGVEIAQRLKSYTDKYDPKGNAPATIASNYMPNENAQKCADVVKLAGYNYTERLYREHRAQYPDWIIYGSETSSAVRSRGIYHFPASAPLLTGEDLQCSSLDNSAVGWGCTARKAWEWDRDTDFCAGQFIWTGFDYIGEPTPYSTKNSYFGIVDTAGFPKDIYYFYQSVWLDPEKHTVLHIVPSVWDFCEGQTIDVLVYSNAASVELFLNGKTLGRQDIDLEKSRDMRAQYAVPFEKGTLSAKAYDKNGAIIAQQSLTTSGDPAAVVMTTQADLSSPEGRPVADGRSIVFAEISVADSEGLPVGNARNRIKVEVSGEGRLVGLDNGDSTDYDSYKGDNRRLFSGKLLAMIMTTDKAGEVTVRAHSEGLRSAELRFTTEKCGQPQGVVRDNAYPVQQTAYTAEIPVRKIELCGGGALTKEQPEAAITARLLPENATYSDIAWKALTPAGIEVNFAQVEPSEGGARVKALGDGEFIVRAYVNNGAAVPQVMAEVPFTASGLGAATRDAYGFIAANTVSGSQGAFNMIENNALGSFDSRTVLTYSNVDFGKTGTQEIALHIGACFDPKIEVWDGTPENGELLADCAFACNWLWNGFAPQTFALSHRVKGVHTISIAVVQGVIFGGFGFTAINRAFDENFTAECDSIYGDDYKTEGRSIVGIGNNVILTCNALDFGEGAHALCIKGAGHNAANPVQLRYTPENGEQQTVFLDFAQSAECTEQRFEIPALKGVNDVSFVFLPGSRFDFYSFRFE